MCKQQSEFVHAYVPRAGVIDCEWTSTVYRACAFCCLLRCISAPLLAQLKLTKKIQWHEEEYDKGAGSSLADGDIKSLTALWR